MPALQMVFRKQTLGFRDRIRSMGWNLLLEFCGRQR